MSAAGRGTERHPRDFYETPPWVTRSLCRELKRRGIFLHVAAEPCCGLGAIVDVLEEEFHGINVWKNDLFTIPDGLDAVKWMYLINPRTAPEICITNPPFSTESGRNTPVPRITNAALDTFDKVIILQRVNWLGSKTRWEWWQDHQPDGMWVLPKRPSFTKNGKTDATEYAWFTWGLGDGVKVLPYPEEYR